MYVGDLIICWNLFFICSSNFAVLFYVLSFCTLSYHTSFPKLRIYSIVFLTKHTKNRTGRRNGHGRTPERPQRFFYLPSLILVLGNNFIFFNEQNTCNKQRIPGKTLLRFPPHTLRNRRNTKKHHSNAHNKFQNNNQHEENVKIDR